MNPGIFLEKVDNINFRNRQTVLSDFFEKGLNKINSQIFLQEKDNVTKLFREFSRKTENNLEYLKKALENSKEIKEKWNENPRNLQTESQYFLENLKKSLYSMTSQQINSVLKPETIYIQENQNLFDIDDNKIIKNNTGKKAKGFDFDDEDKKSVSTNISQNIKKKNLTNFTIEDSKYDIDSFDEQKTKTDIQEKKPNEYKINVLDAEMNLENDESKQKNAKSKKPRGSNKEKKNPSKSKKAEKEEIKMKNEEIEKPNIRKALISEYINPKKRKEEIEIKKPEKSEKKDEKIMNAEQFLGALLDKKTGSFKKQRVFVGSPLGSKKKDKKSGDAFNFF